MSDEMDRCGECPKGECDNCDGCRWAASFHEEPMTVTVDLEGTPTLVGWEK